MARVLHMRIKIALGYDGIQTQVSKSLPWTCLSMRLMWPRMNNLWKSWGCIPLCPKNDQSPDSSATSWNPMLGRIFPTISVLATQIFMNRDMTLASRKSSKAFLELKATLLRKLSVLMKKRWQRIKLKWNSIKWSLLSHFKVQRVKVINKKIVQNPTLRPQSVMMKTTALTPQNSISSRF